MLSENIKTLRKQKGYFQEQLADKLNVVRQTVSKWEKGYSVPDADMLEELADIFEVQVGALLGTDILTEEETTDIGELVKQLTILNDYFSEKMRRRKKTLKIVKRFIVTLLVVALISISCICAIEVVDTIKHKILAYNETDIKLICTLNGEEYTYDLSYTDDSFMAGGYAQPKQLYNFVFDDTVIDKEKTYEEKANEAIDKTKDYFISKGGTCEIIYEEKN